MRRSLVILFAVFTSLYLAHCGTEPVSSNEQKPLPTLCAADSSLIQSDNTFGFKLFQQVLKSDASTNIFISPLSVSMALGMTYNGSRGDTRDQMKVCLELAGLTDQQINESYKRIMEYCNGVDAKVQLRIANSIWYQLGFAVEQDFVNLNQLYFNAVVRELDFSTSNAVMTINGWVSNATNGKINEIVKSIDPSIIMFLINAIYYKGIWTLQFDPQKTTDADFYRQDSSTVKCKMMHRGGKCNTMENGLFKAVELDYGNHAYSMVILLPHPGFTVDTVASLFSQANWNAWMGALAPDSGDIYVPKFLSEYEISLKSMLEALGMIIAFTPLADFTGINQSGGLFIGDVMHKTFVEVNEEGTEAAAVTVVTMMRAWLPEPLIRVDRPFIFAIREKTSGTVLFIGKISEPKAGAGS